MEQKSKLGRPSVDSEAVNVRMKAALLEKIDAFRNSQYDAPNRPQAVIRLVMLALKQIEDNQGF